MSVRLVVAFCRTVCPLCVFSPLITVLEVLGIFVLERKSVKNIGANVDFSIVNQNSKMLMLKMKGF